jgi:glycosyltransferase involved in cell wall biosynthesis
MDLFNISSQKIEVINNSLDPFLFPREKFNDIPNWRAKYAINESDYVLFTLSRLDSRERYKGYDHVIEAMGALIEKHPHLKYVIGGSSDAKELVFINELISKYKLENNVILTGYIAEQDLPAHFLMSDLFIMPSNQEGFGISFIEAMYYGLPVIGGNADGSVDALANGELGSLIEPGNIKSIIDSIQNAILQKGNNKPDFQKVNERFGFETYKEKWGNLLLGLS